MEWIHFHSHFSFISAIFCIFQGINSNFIKNNSVVKFIREKQWVVEILNFTENRFLLVSILDE